MIRKNKNKNKSKSKIEIILVTKESITTLFDTKLWIIDMLVDNW